VSAAVQSGSVRWRIAPLGLDLATTGDC